MVYIKNNGDHGFRQKVEILVGQIPTGKVMTYGQIAAMCGNPRAARIVGGIAHFGNPKLPWHRVVMKSGRLASGYPGGVHGQMLALSKEGVQIKDFSVNIEEVLWHLDIIHEDR
jgi:methylated-DNA-protein-cysteine methyltransferase-like protein